MTSGGARNRAGRKPGPGSELTLNLAALPSAGWQGEVPEFPLPAPLDRELEVWAEAWRTPQACAWAQPSESWRVRTVAMWVRLSVRCEQPEAKAAELAQLHRFADQIGMTTAGLREMGWKVAADAAPAQEAATGTSGTARLERPARRLRAVPDDAQQ